MFNDLFIKMQSKLNENKIEDVSSIKEYCDYMIKKTFKNMFPDEGVNLGDVSSLMRIGSVNLAKLYDADENEVYDTLVSELDDLVPNWRNFIDINTLENSISDVFVNRFFKEKYDDIPDEQEADSFDDVIRNTVNRNIEFGYKMDTKEDMEKFLEKLFHEFFDKNNFYVFTSRYGSRKYVTDKGKEKILEEMMKKINMSSTLSVSDLENEIRENYIKSVIESME